jgi:hypothetical protein
MIERSQPFRQLLEPGNEGAGGEGLKGLLADLQSLGGGVAVEQGLIEANGQPDVGGIAHFPEYCPNR